MPRPVLAGSNPVPTSDVTEVTSILLEDRDTGCEVSPSCLKCPLPVCKFDSPITTQLKKYWKATAVLIAEDTGESLNSVARRVFGMSKSSTPYDFSKDTLETYGFHPYLANLWKQGFRPSSGRGKPSIVRIKQSD